MKEINKSIYQHFFDNKPVVEINSPRVQATGAKSAWDSCVFRQVDGTIADVDISSSKKEVKSHLKGKNIMNHGGISNASSMYRQFWGAKELKLEELENAMKSSNTLPVVFDYVDAVEKSIKSVEKKFKKAHNRDLSNYREMSIYEVQQIGKTPESKTANIKPLNWKLVDVSTRGGKEGQTEIALFSQPAPYASGFDPGLIYLGKSLWDKTKKEITNVGGRGQTTAAQDFGVHGISEIEFGGKKHTLEGVGYLTDYGIKAIDMAEKKGCSGVEIITQTWLKNREPRAIVPLHTIFIK